MRRTFVVVTTAALREATAGAPAQVVDRGPTTAHETTLTFGTAHDTRHRDSETCADLFDESAAGRVGALVGAAERRIQLEDARLRQRERASR